MVEIEYIIINRACNDPLIPLFPCSNDTSSQRNNIGMRRGKREEIKDDIKKFNENIKRIEAKRGEDLSIGSNSIE